MNVILILLLYVIIVNIVGFAEMGIDKRRAKRGAFRIPEANLFLSAVIGGSIGCIAGMYAFRHQTKHKSFVFGMPAILIVQLAAILYLLLAAPVPVSYTHLDVYKRQRLIRVIQRGCSRLSRMTE